MPPIESSPDSKAWSMPNTGFSMAETVRINLAYPVITHTHYM